MKSNSVTLDRKIEINNEIDEFNKARARLYKRFPTAGVIERASEILTRATWTLGCLFIGGVAGVLLTLLWQWIF